MLLPLQIGKLWSWAQLFYLISYLIDLVDKHPISLYLGDDPYLLLQGARGQMHEGAILEGEKGPPTLTLKGNYPPPINSGITKKEEVIMKVKEEVKK